MTIQSDVKAGTASPVLSKNDPSSPAIFITADGGISIKSATVFNGRKFLSDMPVEMPAGGLIAGADYAVLVGERLAVVLAQSLDDINEPMILGGFHFAPGGNATARAGGDETPAINPRSLWDRNFRPACANPCGMELTERFGLRFWADIYMCGVNHLTDGTSRFGVTIADGVHCPLNPKTGKPFKQFDYATAVAVVEHHGKQLCSYDEFRALAYGVTERTAADGNPKTTGLDAARTSADGIMQATGNKWTWGHDGDPDTPRASIFGGSYWGGDNAGSRCANGGDWADSSCEDIGARGRSDHLQLG